MGELSRYLNRNVDIRRTQEAYRQGLYAYFVGLDQGGHGQPAQLPAEQVGGVNILSDPQRQAIRDEADYRRATTGDAFLRDDLFALRRHLTEQQDYRARRGFDVAQIQAAKDYHANLTQAIILQHAPGDKLDDVMPLLWRNLRQEHTLVLREIEATAAPVPPALTHKRDNLVDLIAFTNAVYTQLNELEAVLADVALPEHAKAAVLTAKDEIMVQFRDAMRGEHNRAARIAQNAGAMNVDELTGGRGALARLTALKDYCNGAQLKQILAKYNEAKAAIDRTPSARTASARADVAAIATVAGGNVQGKPYQRLDALDRQIANRIHAQAHAAGPNHIAAVVFPHLQGGGTLMGLHADRSLAQLEAHVDQVRAAAVGEFNHFEASSFSAGDQSDIAKAAMYLKTVQDGLNAYLGPLRQRAAGKLFNASGDQQVAIVITLQKLVTKALDMSDFDPTNTNVLLGGMADYPGSSAVSKRDLAFLIRANYVKQKIEECEALCDNYSIWNPFKSRIQNHFKSPRLKEALTQIKASGAHAALAVADAHGYTCQDLRDSFNQESGKVRLALQSPVVPDMYKDTHSQAAWQAVRKECQDTAFAQQFTDKQSLRVTPFTP